MNRRTARLVDSLARAALPLLMLAAPLLGTACRTGNPGRVSSGATAGRETVVTESEIRAMGVSNAWDVVRLRAPRLVMGTSGGGVRIQEQRSVNSDETPLLVVDGTQMLDLGYLSQIPASEITLIRILDAEAAYPLYGLRAAGGAVIVQTKGS